MSNRTKTRGFSIPLSLSRAAPLMAVLGLTPFIAAADKPNFVWLLSEDNSKHYMKLFDPNGARTPHIETMAQHGLAFAHAFSNSPVCSVARSTLITGCYAPRIGTQFHRKAVTVPMPQGLRMFPAYLREAGYYTTNNKKKDYNAIEGKGVWDESSGKATWRNRKPGQPFFHMQSFGTTHESSLHFPAATMATKRTTTDPASVAVAPYHPNTPLFRYTYARYHDRIRQMDGQIGKIIAQLQEDGLLEDTFVFYFGDHGGVLPGSKGYIYERGIHVPLVVRVPEKWKDLVDAPYGTRVQGFVSFIDFGPTLLHLAGVTVPDGMDGRPYLGKGITLADVNKRDETFAYADRFDEKYDLVRTLRKGRYKYMRSYQPFNFDGLWNNYRYRMAAYRQWLELYRAGKLNAVQRQFFERRAPEALYDIESNPHETKNLAADPAYASVLAQIRTRFTTYVKGLPDLSLYPESYLADKAFTDPVAFGQANNEAIGRLIDIADLSLLPFAKAAAGIDAALASSDPWQRYWGLIVCSSHGKAAAPFVQKATALAASDPELLVRTRAAEFLGCIGAADPRPTIMEVLRTSTSGIEAALVMNTIVLLKDGPPGYTFTIDPGAIASETSPARRHETEYVRRRLQYLLPGKQAAPKADRAKKRAGRKARKRKKASRP